MAWAALFLAPGWVFGHSYDAVAAVADHTEFRRVRWVEASLDQHTDLVVLHDPGHSLDERILREQFGY